MKTTIYLVRHGRTKWNAENCIQGKCGKLLNNKGKSQANTLAKKFRNIHFDAVYSSPSPRTKQTVKIIAPGKKPIIYPAFRERGYGNLVGLTGSQLKKCIPDIEEQWARWVLTGSRLAENQNAKLSKEH